MPLPALILLNPQGTVPKFGHVRTMGGPNGPVFVQVAVLGPLDGNGSVHAHVVPKFFSVAYHVLLKFSFSTP